MHPKLSLAGGTPARGSPPWPVSSPATFLITVATIWDAPRNLQTINCMNINERFKNKVAVVTGSATGIGRAVALRLGKEGAILALFDMNKELLQETIEQFKEMGIRAKGFVVDISDEPQVSQAVQDVESEFEKIDILVNAAGIVGPTSTKITDYATAEFDILRKG